MKSARTTSCWKAFQEFSALLASKGLEEVKETMILETLEDGETKVFFRLLTPGGKELSATNLSSWGRLIVSQAALRRIAKDAKPVLETIDIRGRRHQARTVYGPIGPGMFLQIGLSLEDNDELLAGFRQTFGATLAGVMVVAAFLGWLMARRALTHFE
ncbi:MAG: hypothetical protein ACREQK_04275 [Candidatus Binatia bacterium]